MYIYIYINSGLLEVVDAITQKLIIFINIAFIVCLRIALAVGERAKAAVFMECLSKTLPHTTSCLLQMFVPGPLSPGKDIRNTGFRKALSLKPTGLRWHVQALPLYLKSLSFILICLLCLFFFYLVSMSKIHLTLKLSPKLILESTPNFVSTLFCMCTQALRHDSNFHINNASTVPVLTFISTCHFCIITFYYIT